MDFISKTFWITGAASGMGKSVSIALSKYKTRLIISDRDTEGLQVTAEEIKKNRSTVRIEVLDMSDTESIVATAKKVIDDGENIAGLYQFAGLSQRT